MLRLQQQLIVAIVVPASVVLGVVGVVADQAAYEALDRALGDHLSAVAAAAAAKIDPRTALLGPGQDDARLARAAGRDLSRLVDGTGVERIVVASFDGKTIADSQNQLKIGEPYLRADVDAAEIQRARDGGRAASVLFSGPQGRLHKSGYAPLRDETGIVAVIAVQARATNFEVLKNARIGLAVLCLCGFAALFLLASFVARRVTIPLARLADAAGEIGQGSLSTQIPTGGPQETQVLGEAMASMGKALSDRDEQMQLMLAGIAHEVRNPLAGIQLFAGLLEDELEPEDERRSHVLRISNEIDALAHIVNDFLAFARKPELERRLSEIDVLLNEVQMVAAAEAETKSVKLKTSVEGPPHFMLDTDAVKGALLNLVQNAIQASPVDGTVAISAKIDGEKLTIVVRDQGAGVAADLAENIWHSFKTTRQKGTGLGLALVRRTAEAHGGRAELTNPGEPGARFVLELLASTNTL